VLAHERSLQRSDAIGNWHDAEQDLIRTRAYYLSQRRTGAPGDSYDDWAAATRNIHWAKWVGSNLWDCRVEGVARPYLALAASRKCEALAARLAQVCQVGTERRIVAFVAALDGAPEYARFRLAGRHAGAGTPSEDGLERKDGSFFETCRSVLALHRARIVEGGGVCSSREAMTHERTFQDACIGCFKGDASLCAGVVAALHLRRFLDGSNYRQADSWQEERHARIVVASSWQMALRELAYAYRDEILIESDAFSSLEGHLKQTWLAAGVRLVTSRVEHG
jgi:hypothetical protein